jgi:hypothetical protein
MPKRGGGSFDRVFGTQPTLDFVQGHVVARTKYATVTSDNAKHVCACVVGAQKLREVLQPYISLVRGEAAGAVGVPKRKSPDQRLFVGAY